MSKDSVIPNIGESSYVIRSISEALGRTSPLFDLLKYEIDKHIYYYGSHFRFPYENNRTAEDVRSEVEYRFDVLSKDLHVLCGVENWADRIHDGQSNSLTIVCNAYHSWQDQLRQTGWVVEEPIWVETTASNELEFLLRRACSNVLHLCRIDFQLLLSELFFGVLETCLQLLRIYYSPLKYKACLVPYTLPFFEGGLVKVFREVKRPTFLAMHGLLHHASFWEYREHQVDFYVVWGQQSADDLHTIGGLPKDKIVVSGHPDSVGVPPKDLKNSLEDILVLSRCSAGAPSYKLGIYQNRAEQVDYIYRVQKVLKKLGVKNVRLRPHPSESLEWYERFVDGSFYHIDRTGLKESLERSTFVIGPISTVFIEALLGGLNYCIFEPAQDYNHCSYEHYSPTRPWDGSDPRIPVAKSDEELEFIVKNLVKPDISFIADYIRPQFNPHCIGDAIKLYESQIPAEENL